MKQSTDNTLIREEVLENSIDQLVVIQYGKKSGVNIEDDFFSKYIDDYKKQYLQQYEKGILIYGEEEFHKGLKYHLIYQQTKKIVISEKIKDVNITEEVLQDFLLSKKWI